MNNEKDNKGKVKTVNKANKRKQLVTIIMKRETRKKWFEQGDGNDTRI